MVLNCLINCMVIGRQTRDGLLASVRFMPCKTCSTLVLIDWQMFDGNLWPHEDYGELKGKL